MMKPSQRFLNMVELITGLQEKIKNSVETLEEKRFETVDWKHSDKGGGRSLTFSDGKVFEKAGLLTSNITSVLSEEVMKLLKVQQRSFRACGISLVFHPRSPMIPTVHLNLRYFEMEQDDWFGGGIDLTPYYPFEEDFVYFHQVLQAATSRVYPDRYGEFKKRCDDYFYLPHRQEMRGIGGVFFDYLKDRNQEENHKLNFDLMKHLGDCFNTAYFPLVEKRKNTPYGKEEIQFQKIRRGRYVEFNLLYDRGTLFGLKTGGRVDSILISLPPEVSFPVEEKIKSGSFQAKMKKYYQARKWV